MRYLLVTLLVSSCAVATQVVAADKKNGADVDNSAQHTNSRPDVKRDRFTDAERTEYKSYYQKQSKYKKYDTEDGQEKYHGNKGHDKAYSDLPPGLQKKVARGESLPPGWQKKVNNGQVFSPELRTYSKRSPYPSPGGTSDYILEDKVIRVMDSTNVILDVLSN